MSYYTKTITGQELPFGYVFTVRPAQVDDEGNLFYQTGPRDEKGRRQGTELTDIKVIEGMGQWHEVTIQEAVYKDDVMTSVEQWDIKTGKRCLYIEEFDHHQNPQGRYYKKQNGQTWDGCYEGLQFTGSIVTEGDGFWKKEAQTMGVLRAEHEKKWDQEKYFERQVKYDWNGNITYRKTNKNGIMCVDYQEGKKLKRPILSTPKMRRNCFILKCCGIAAVVALGVGGIKVASRICQGPAQQEQQVNQR